LSLDEYKKRRDFTKTPEPEPEVQPGANQIFVIQRHQARNLHWDLRLERNGVLVSWAIPKEPPREKGVRRLAIQTEDHPMEYGSFEGCLNFYTSIITEDGAKYIGRIVNKRESIRVLSYNSSTDMLEWKPIINWFRNGRTIDFLRIRIPGQFGGRRIVTITGNHKVYTPRGMRIAKDLKEGEDIYVPGFEWSEEQYQILAGTLLGDAHIELSAETRLPCFQLTHSGRQLRYLEFIRNQLNPSSVIRKKKGSDSFKFRFTSPSLKNIYPRFYQNKRKIILKEVLRGLDERGLAIWYMDDGYLSAGKYVEFCTHGYTKDENHMISNYLKEEWEIDSKVYFSKPRKTSTGGYFIHVGKVGSARFLTLINDYIIDNLRYKTFYKKKRLRWKFSRGRETIIPAHILSIEKATKKQIINQTRYDIQVEDNNNYFAGPMLVSNSIPEGEYGAGTVELWDVGEYETVKWEENEIIVVIHGNRLEGQYCLIRFKKVKDGWLFFRCGE
jgi:hypothetical protein